MLYTVVGDWDGERYAQKYDTISPDDAEGLMAMKVAEEGGVFWAVAVLLGDVNTVDRYAFYVDLDNPRHADRDDLVPAQEELEMAEWTVFGRLLSHTDQRWNERTGGERYCAYEMALSPDTAERVVCSRVADNRESHLLVCGVLPGRVKRMDSHVFCNRQQRPS